VPNEHFAEKTGRNQIVTNLHLSVLRLGAENGTHEIKQISQTLSGDLFWVALANIPSLSGGSVSLRRQVA
jgi:hypothetical protein